ncbi:hypothetical protein [Pseudovibrio sp. FO-BEG1]|uniref:hypothetical protein n=1 Tax=Pseudovibrio sp. (strain FO-BEG1) TaxID=911045 RepID=UPI0005A1678C|nr:hypothetical protein [Pseudovibrio sp. FO-BEG1]
MPKFNWKHFFAFAAIGIASSLIASFYTVSVIGYWAGGVPEGTITIQTTEEHWVREWIGATSGWVAAIAAITTIFVLLFQSKTAQRDYKKRVAKDTRKQLVILHQWIKAVAQLGSITPKKLCELFDGDWDHVLYVSEMRMAQVSEIFHLRNDVIQCIDIDDFVTLRSNFGNREHAEKANFDKGNYKEGSEFFCSYSHQPDNGSENMDDVISSALKILRKSQLALTEELKKLEKIT